MWGACTHAMQGGVGGLGWVCRGSFRHDLLGVHMGVCSMQQCGRSHAVRQWVRMSRAWTACMHGSGTSADLTTRRIMACPLHGGERSSVRMRCCPWVRPCRSRWWAASCRPSSMPPRAY